jgi:hypothetical protein
LKVKVRAEHDFDPIRDDPEFDRLVYGTTPSA